jgi:hypothetical protein
MPLRILTSDTALYNNRKSGPTKPTHEIKQEVGHAGKAKVLLEDLFNEYRYKPTTWKTIAP